MKRTREEATTRIEISRFDVPPENVAVDVVVDGVGTFEGETFSNRRSRNFEIGLALDEWYLTTTTTRTRVRVRVYRRF